ncbi:WD40 repeat-like protein [Rhizopogon salebrosus TDB-379]|nr:WD40 repeat-like protein [Rhizopogon salebrosus TDB-379]
MLEGRETYVNYLPDSKRVENPYDVPISYFPDGKQMINGSGDETVRLWDLKTGKEVEEAQVLRQQGVCEVAVSRDGHWVITTGRDPFRAVPGELKACEVDTGIVKIFNGHSYQVMCIDISLYSKQLASGSFDSTARIWNLDTGELVAGPFKTGVWVTEVRFSQNLKKLAVRSESGNSLQVWDVRASSPQCVGQRKTEPSLRHLPLPRSTQKRFMNSIHRGSRLLELPLKDAPTVTSAG